MDKTTSRRNEIYVIIGIIISLCACCGTWLAVPQLQLIFNNHVKEPVTQIPTPDGEALTSDTGKTHKVTIINNAGGYLRFDNTYIAAPEQLITFDIGEGLHKVSIDYSSDGGTTWRLNSSLELNLDSDIIFNCKDRSALEQTFKAIGVILGIIDFDEAYGVKCVVR
jgi:hypothetical protein